MADDVRQALEQYAARETHMGDLARLDEYAPLAFAALRDVVEMHAKYLSRDGYGSCAECGWSGRWPCPTLRAILSALAAENE